MHKKKINPRRRPASQADVERAKLRAQDDAIKQVVYMVLYIVIDKHDAPLEDVQQLGREINELAESITQGYVSVEDIRRVVEDEYGVTWEV